MLEQRISPGDRVRLRFALRLQDGTPVAETPADAPMEITLGAGDLLPMFEHRLAYLGPGESGHFEIPADETREALGRGAVQTLPRSDFPESLDIRPGNVIEFRLPNGEDVPGRVVSLEPDQVTVDFTHPLAGHALVFEVEVLEVLPGP